MLQQVHEYLRSKLCSLYENDCIFDKFECCWSGNDSAIMTGSYNNFFRVFDRTTKRDLTLEAARDIAKPKTLLKPRKVSTFTRSCFIHKSHIVRWLKARTSTYICMRLRRYAPVASAKRMKLASTVWTLIRKYFTLRGIHLKMWWLSLLRTISSYSKTNSSTSVCKYVNNLNWILSRGSSQIIIKVLWFCMRRKPIVSCRLYNGIYWRELGTLNWKPSGTTGIRVRVMIVDY